MRGDDVRQLALRSVHDDVAAAVLGDVLLEQPEHQKIVWKLITRAWGRWMWPLMRANYRFGLLKGAVASLSQRYEEAYLGMVSRDVWSKRVWAASLPKLKANVDRPPTVAQSPAWLSFEFPVIKGPNGPEGNRAERRRALARARRGR